MGKMAKFFKDAISGRFVSKRYADEHKDTTYESEVDQFTPITCLSIVVPPFCKITHKFVKNVIEVDVATNYKINQPILWYPFGYHLGSKTR